MQPTMTLRGDRSRLLQQLLERHATDLAACKHDLRGSVESVDAVEDMESSMMRESRGLGAAMASIQSRTVQLIEASLQRLESGKYGRCSDCNSPIAWARLNALPFADTCRDCQDRRDQTGGAMPILV